MSGLGGIISLVVKGFNSFLSIKSANIYSDPFVSGCLLNNRPNIDYLDTLPKYDLTRGGSVMIF